MNEQDKKLHDKLVNKIRKKRNEVHSKALSIYTSSIESCESIKALRASLSNSNDDILVCQIPANTDTGSLIEIFKHLSNDFKIRLFSEDTLSFPTYLMGIGSISKDERVIFVTNDSRRYNELTGLVKRQLEIEYKFGLVKVDVSDYCKAVDNFRNYESLYNTTLSQIASLKQYEMQGGKYDQLTYNALHALDELEMCSFLNSEKGRFEV